MFQWNSHQFCFKRWPVWPVSISFGPIYSRWQNNPQTTWFVCWGNVYMRQFSGKHKYLNLGSTPHHTVTVTTSWTPTSWHWISHKLQIHMGFTVYLPRVFLQETGTTEAYGRVWMLKLWGHDAGFWNHSWLVKKCKHKSLEDWQGSLKCPSLGESNNTNLGSFCRVSFITMHCLGWFHIVTPEDWCSRPFVILCLSISLLDPAFLW